MTGFLLTEATASSELKALWQRWLKGVDWLMEHDPTGSFHVWFGASISPRAKMPGQEEARRLEYAEYHRNRVLWEDIDRKCLSMEAIEEAALAAAGGT